MSDTPDGDFRSILLTHGRYTVSLHIDKKDARLCIKDDQTVSISEELIIGLQEGRPFLQVSFGHQLKSVDLLDAIGLLEQLIDKGE